jgi:hypothetical protein
MQTPGGTSTLSRRFAIVALVLVGGIATSSLAAGPTRALMQGVDQVRDVGVSWVAFAAGPVRLTPDGSAQARLWLPATQRGVKVTFLGDRGEMLGQVDVEAPPGGARSSRLSSKRPTTAGR